MAVNLIPAGPIVAVATVATPKLLVSKVWQPHAPPKPIGPGELDATKTATDRVYWQWQEGENFLALAGIIGRGGDLIAAEQLEISEYRYIETGWGQILDEWGAFVDFKRRGVPDAFYRSALRARGASTAGDGGIDAVMLPARTLLGDDNVSYLPQYPAGFCWGVSISLPIEVLDILVDLLTPVVPLGVSAKILLTQTVTPGWGSSAGASSWTSSWASSAGAVSLSAVAPWTHAVNVG